MVVKNNKERDGKNVTEKQFDTSYMCDPVHNYWQYAVVKATGSVSRLLQEPVAFLGGMFAGALRLSLTDDPLRQWLQRTADAAGDPPPLNDESAN